MSNLDQVLDPDRMGTAYARFARRAGIWSPGLPMSRVRTAPISHMLRLSHEIRSRTYRAHAPRPISISKADGTLRQLSIYAVRDRIVQRALIDVLQPESETRFDDASFGFRRGRGVVSAIQRARSALADGRCWVIDADIQKCFDRIPRKQLIDAVNAWTHDATTSDLVARSLGWSDKDMAKDARGVPQGACISPWLCNVYLHAFDTACRGAGARLVRYADDFVIFGESQSAMRHLLTFVRENLLSLGLVLHPAKTRIAHIGEGIRFLGATLSVDAHSNRR